MRVCCDTSRNVNTIVFVDSLIEGTKKLLGDSRDKEATVKIYTVYTFFSVIDIN